MYVRRLFKKKAVEKRMAQRISRMIEAPYPVMSSCVSLYCEEI
jgi:hypothetical protein